jgi:hypothetical protein
MGMNLQQRRRSMEAEQRFDGGDLMRSYIAGATTLRRLEFGGVTYRRGATLTRAQVLDVAPRNLRAMIVNHFLEVKLGPPQRKESPNAVRS